MDHNLVPPFITQEALFEVNDQEKIHSSEPIKQHHLIWDAQNELRIPLQLCGNLSVFITRQLTQEEISQGGDYKVIFVSFDDDSWNSHFEDWAAMEEDILDYDGEIKQRDPTQQMKIIQHDYFFDVSALYVIRFSGEYSEKHMDSLISSAYVINPQVGETMRNTTMQY